MSTLDIHFTINSTTPIPPADVTTVALIRELLTFHGAVPLVSFKLLPVTGTSYSYKFVAIDGRHWNQVIDFATPTNPAMTFAVPDGWQLTEFAAQRALRDLVVRLYGLYGVSSIVALF